MRKSPILPLWLTALLAVVFIVSGLTVSAFAFLTLDAILERPLNPVAAAAEEVRDTSLPPLDQAGLAIPPTLAVGESVPTPLPTAVIPPLDSDRINVLLMGIDRRPGQPFISRTDTMMLLSINPRTNRAAMLSIPRDLYVVIPGRGRDRINTAFVYGSQGNNPAGGAALAMQTVEYNLGVRVHHYVMVDFNAVITTVDLVGGITVDVPVNISDPTYPDMNYGYDPFYLAAGRHHLDGATALKYARTRHQDSDIGRAQRQQQVILAFRNRLLELGLGEMLTRAPALLEQVSDGVRTDLSVEEIIQLGRAAAGIEAGDLQTAVLDFSYVSSHTTEHGASVLVLNNARAADLIAELFYAD